MKSILITGISDKDLFIAAVILCFNNTKSSQKGYTISGNSIMLGNADAEVQLAFEMQPNGWAEFLWNWYKESNPMQRMKGGHNAQEFTIEYLDHWRQDVPNGHFIKVTKGSTYLGK